MIDPIEPFGPFLLLKPLGKGGMGVVYIARTHFPAHPLAALKRLRPDALDVPTFAERFAHEGALAVRLSHPNLVETLDVGTAEGAQYVASAFIAGKDTGLVSDRLAERSRGAPLGIAVRLLLDGLEGLAYVHNAREHDGSPLHLVHRDITPGNLLLGYDGIARIADFGLAKSALTEHLQLTDEGMILGTPRYLPREVVIGEKAVPASDIYGLGAVLYRVLTTIPPYDGTPREVVTKILNERPPPLSALRPDLPAWFTTFLEEMMEPKVEKRPAAAGALARRLQAEAAAHRALATRETVQRWLIDLFPEEHQRELREHEEMLHTDRPAAPIERTRIVRAPTRPLQAFEADDTTTELPRPTPDTKPATELAPRTPTLRTILLILAAWFAAVIGGLLVGVYLLNTNDDRRWALIERLGAARQRAPGDQRLEHIRRSIQENRLDEAEHDLETIERP